MCSIGSPISIGLSVASARNGAVSVIVCISLQVAKTGFKNGGHIPLDHTTHMGLKRSKKVAKKNQLAHFSK